MTFYDVFRKSRIFLWPLSRAFSRPIFPQFSSLIPVRACFQFVNIQGHTFRVRLLTTA